MRRPPRPPDPRSALWPGSHLLAGLIPDAPSPRVLYPLSIIGGLVVWELWARELPQVILAPPSAVLLRLVKGLTTADLPVAFVRSLGHLLLGYTLALVVAIPLGFLMGRSETLFQALDPLVNALYAIPPVAFVPFLVIWFGLFLPARVALVFLMCVFEILVTVSTGVRDVQPGLLEVGRSFGARRRTLIKKVVFPASLPFLFTALRIGLVRGINAMITAELFFAAVNLGQIMKDSASRFDTAGLLGVIVLLSGFGLAVQEGLKALEARALPWHIRS